MKKGFLIIFLLSLGFKIWAQEPKQFYSEVISVDNKNRTLKITHDNKQPWTVDDSVCITKDGKDVACGIVTQTDQELATVLLTSQTEEVNQETASDAEGNYVQLTFSFPLPEKGNSVRLVDKSPSFGIREISSQLKSNHEFGGEKLNNKVYDYIKANGPFNPEGNITAGFNLLFPTVEYQQTISEHSAIGVMPIFMSYSVSDGSVKGTGCFINYHYYSEGTLLGYWGRFGLGVYGLNYKYGRKEDSNVTPAVSAIFGKRLFKNDHLNFGFGAGAQYIYPTTQTGLAFNGFIPSLVVDIGFAF